MSNCLQLYNFNATFVGMYVVKNHTKSRYRKATYSLFIEILHKAKSTFAWSPRYFTIQKKKPSLYLQGNFYKGLTVSVSHFRVPG